MLQIDLGDNSTCGQVTQLCVQPGDTVTVKNVAGSTLNYWTVPGGSVSTIASSASHAFSQAPAWLSSQGRTSVQITGTNY